MVCLPFRWLRFEGGQATAAAVELKDGAIRYRRVVRARPAFTHQPPSFKARAMMLERSRINRRTIAVGHSARISGAVLQLKRCDPQEMTSNEVSYVCNRMP